MRVTQDREHDNEAPPDRTRRASRDGRPQQATEIRRRLAEVEADQEALRERRTDLEKFLLAAPASTWLEAADKARYLIGLLATTSLARDPRRRKLIAGVLDDFRRLSGEPAAEELRSVKSDVTGQVEH